MAAEMALRRLKRCRQDAAQTDGKELPQPLPQAVSANAFIIVAGPSSTHGLAEVSGYYVSTFQGNGCNVSRQKPAPPSEGMPIRFVIITACNIFLLHV